MSINGTLTNALSGLVAASRAAEVVSSNVANALTEGYGRRELQVSAMSVAGVGAGVRVDGIRRDVDNGLIADRRAADAGLGAARTLAGFFDAVERSIGLPGEEGSINTKFARLEASLVEASSRPDSESRLLNVLRASQDLVSQINTVSDAIQSQRQEADGAISKAVESLNTTLRRIADLNRDVRLQAGAGRDASALKDQRQAAIDSISELVPIVELERDHGEIALITIGGAILVDGKAAEIGFTPVGTIMPDMTRASGALGGLSLNGEPVDTSRNSHAFRAGALAALFDIRDTRAVTAQAALDGLARDLVERFETPAADPTLPAGAAGLFTDAGLALDPADEIGLAGRLAVNARANPDRGGDIWRLRAGLHATDPGEPGRSDILSGLAEVLQAARVPPSGGYMASTRSAAGLAADLLSRVSAERQSADVALTQSEAKQQALQALELQDGVDTDHEMQELLLIEQAYAANAKVVKAVDDMIKQLLGL
jgi:flagellar hook-associated protein 1 FlgK